jgi:hypothetical protein
VNQRRTINKPPYCMMDDGNLERKHFCMVFLSHS